SDGIYLHRIIRTVVALIAGAASHVFHQVNRVLVALAEDGVLAIEPGGGAFGDEKLRAIGIRSGVGVGQPSADVELEVGRNFVIHIEAGAAGAVSERVATLNHEAGDNAMENGAIVERLVRHFAGLWILPGLRAIGQANKVGNRVGSFI